MYQYQDLCVIIQRFSRLASRIHREVSSIPNRSSAERIACVSLLASAEILLAEARERVAGVQCRAHDGGCKTVVPL